MKLTNKNMVTQALTRIEVLRKDIENLQAIQRRIGSRYTADYKKPDFGNIFQLLIEKELDEWRGVFMWALTLDDKERDRIKAAAHQAFLREGISVSHWWNDGETPGAWMSADEDAFRKMAKKAFGPSTEDES